METLTTQVFNVMLNMFNLQIEHGKLFYKHKLRFGSIDFAILEMDEEGVQKLADFLELPYIPWGDTAEDLYYALANSKYFNPRVFLSNISANKEYKEFCEIIKKEKPVTLYKPVYTPGYKAYLVDSFFNTKIYFRIKQLTRLGISKKNLRNKFNGHLVMKWVPETKPGRVLKETMEEFKIHIENRFKTNFLEYLANRPNRIIRLDFQFFFYKDLEFFIDEGLNELPF